MSKVEKFEPSFESLLNYECPEWFRDAKFGIWSHWGPQSVPMFGDWYAKYMYMQGTPQANYHRAHYGHPSEFGYKDICALWKAENFNADELMDLYYKAGARYFVAQAMHHDNFFNYESKLNRFNSVDVGPKKDICMMWKNAAEKYNMPFGLTEHLSASFSWWRTNKGCDKDGPYKGVPYDGNDPEYQDFYYDNAYLNEGNDIGDFKAVDWYAQNEKFQKYWLETMEEIIDKFEPDLLYSDGPIPFGCQSVTGQVEGKELYEHKSYKTGLEAISKLYNKSIEKYGENRAVYNQKDRRPEIYKVGTLDIEKSQLPDILPYPWQTDTCIGNWFYNAAAPVKKPGHIIEMLVDIISKNGSMLLNILQKPDGSIDDDAKYILQELAKWFAVCSEGVYFTRPWKQSGEGDTKVVIKHFTEDQAPWNSSDIRFTKKDNNVYAFLLKAPETSVAILKSFVDEKVTNVELLGYGKVEFSHLFGILTVKLPESLPTEYTNCLKITIE